MSGGEGPICKLAPLAHTAILRRLTVYLNFTCIIPENASKNRDVALVKALS